MVTRRTFANAFLLLPLVVASFWLASCATRTDTEAEARFREMFNSTLSSRLLITPEKDTYNREEVIVFWVENRTGQALWFRDQSFGVLAFVYDGVGQTWSEVDLGFVESIPTPMAVEPGRAEFPGIVYVGYLDPSIAGAIRLVIMGHTNLDNPELDQVFTGYAAVEIAR